LLDSCFLIALQFYITLRYRSILRARKKMD